MEGKFFPQWLRTDETTEAVLALEMVSEQLSKTQENPYYWKWAVIALHNTFQGFMVLALTGSNPLNVLTDKCAERWLKAYDRKDGRYPQPRLAEFPELYGRIKSERMLLGISSKVFSPSPSQEYSVTKLNELRNDFIHFTPKSWSLEISGMPAIFIDCMQIIKFLLCESNNIDFYDESMKERAEQGIEKVKEGIEGLSQ